MRFSIQNIADWILDYLFENKSESDRQLHWLCCNDFLTRDEIIQNGKQLSDFSKNFDYAIEGLKNENYIFHNDADNVFVFSEIDRKYIKPLLIQKKQRSKIKCFYVAVFENGCKIGITTNLKNRAMEYCKPWSKELKRLSVLQCEDPVSVEKHLKDCFKRFTKTRSTEFLYMPFEDIEKEVLAFEPLSIFENYEFESYFPRQIN